MAVRRVGVCGLLSVWFALSCQDYPFEPRPNQKVEARKITEVIATVSPTDILFVIDNSASMLEEITELRANVNLFVDELSKSDIDFRVGILSTDVECNVPDADCSAGNTSTSCCAIKAGAGESTPFCVDSDNNSDTVFEYSTCDGGRLRSPDGLTRMFLRPSASERAQWVTDVSNTLDGLGINGSSFEAGLEAVERAVSCSLNDGCNDPVVADINAGFIRSNADLVLIFLTDEDDCSVRDANRYKRPNSPSDPGDQAARLCNPNACYAHYGVDSSGNILDVSPFNGIMDWVDAGLLNCDGATRTVNVPDLQPVSDYLDRLIQLKGNDVRRIRAAAILGSIVDVSSSLGFRRAACYKEGTTPSVNCGCWSSTGSSFYCQVTDIIGQGNTPSPTNSPFDGCGAMPGGRYVTFLEDLAMRRVLAGARESVLIDSICQSKYDDTLFRIVNDVILTDCFDLGEVPPSADKIAMTLNGNLVPQVPLGSSEPGYSWVAGASQICLEGGLTKNLGDEFEIFLLGDES